MLSTMGLRVQRFYDGRLWTKLQVHDVTRVGAISANEYEIIMGEAYDVNNPPEAVFKP